MVQDTVDSSELARILRQDKLTVDSFFSDCIHSLDRIIASAVEAGAIPASEADNVLRLLAKG